MTLGTELPHTQHDPYSTPAVGLRVVAHIRDYGHFPGTIIMLCRTGVTIQGHEPYQKAFFPWANVLCLDLDPEP